MMTSMSPRALACAAVLTACTATSPSSQQVPPQQALPQQMPEQQAPPEAPEEEVQPVVWQHHGDIGGCELSTADTHRVREPSIWEPCDADPPSCQFARVVPPGATGARFYGGFTVDGPYIAETWKHGKRSSMHLRPLDSSPILLVAVEGPSCEIRDVAVSKDTVSVMVTSDLVKSAADAAAFLVGPLGDDPSWHTAAAKARVSGPRPFHLLHGRTITLVDRNGLRRAGPGEHSFPPMVGFFAMYPWAVAAGDTILFGDGEDDRSAELLRPEGPPRVLLEVGARQRLGGLVADGDRLYWLVGDTEPVEPFGPIDRDWQFGEIHLWTATLSAEGKAARPRKLAKLNLFNPGQLPTLHAFNGRLAFTTRGAKDRMLSSDLTIVDAATGETYEVGFPNHIHVGQIVVLAKREVVLTLAFEFQARGLVRVPLGPE